MPQCNFPWESEVQGKLAFFGSQAGVGGVAGEAYEGEWNDRALTDVCVNTEVLSCGPKPAPPIYTAKDFSKKYTVPDPFKVTWEQPAVNKDQSV